jgi:hypothetical protein
MRLRRCGWKTLSRRLSDHLSYANVAATVALLIALGGTSYAAVRIGSGQIVDNSVRSRDIRNGAINGRDVRPNGLGGGAIKESVLREVPRAVEASRLSAVAMEQPRVRCPPETLPRVGVCIEAAARATSDFFSAVATCSSAGRGLPTYAQLDFIARSRGPLASEGEWTASMVLEPPTTAPTSERLEALLIANVGTVDHVRVLAPNQRPFRCVALPSN